MQKESAIGAAVLATAWSVTGEALADTTTVRVSVTPTQELTNVKLLLSSLNSSPESHWYSVADAAPAGVTSTFDVTVATDGLVDFEGDSPVVYSLLALYGEAPTNDSVAVLVANPDDLLGQEDWASTFFGSYLPTEAEVGDELIADVNDSFGLAYDLGFAFGNEGSYPGSDFGTLARGVELGRDGQGGWGTLLYYSDAAMGGTAQAVLIPEPTALALGLALACGWLTRRGTRTR